MKTNAKAAHPTIPQSQITSAANQAQEGHLPQYAQDLTTPGKQHVVRKPALEEQKLQRVVVHKDSANKNFINQKILPNVQQQQTSLPQNQSKLVVQETPGKGK